MTRHVAIFLFDEVEVLDFAGPFEVFSVTAALNDPQPFEVSTVSQSVRQIIARNGLAVVPRYGFDSCPPVDLLVVPGGLGTRALIDDRPVIRWVRALHAKAELTLSVCTGSLLLARAGLLTDGRATTHHAAFRELRQIEPSIEVVEDARMVVQGDVITSGGISAGIDMSLSVVARLLGEETARRTADYMEYDWRADTAADS